MIENGMDVIYFCCVGLSLFGVLGFNVYFILEEYILVDSFLELVLVKNEEVMILLFVRNKDCLQVYVVKFFDFLSEDVNFVVLVYILQIGWVEMEEWVVFIVKDIKDLIVKF